MDVTEFLRFALDDTNMHQKSFWWQEKWEVAGLLQPVSRSITDSNTPGGRSVCSLGKTVGFD